MKKIFFALASAAFVIAFSCNSAKNETITLKFNLPKGSSYDYNMDMDLNMSGTAGGQQMSMKNNMQMGYRFGVTDDSAGWKKISATFSRIAMDMDAGGMTINFD